MSPCPGPSCTLAGTAEPTIKDVVEILAKMREEMATKADLAKVEANVAKLETSVGKVEANVAKLETNVAKLETKLEAGLAKVDGKVESVRSEVVSVRADLGTVRSEMRARFDELDEELSKHADTTHRDLERRVAALEATPRRPATAVPAGGPDTNPAQSCPVLA